MDIHALQLEDVINQCREENAKYFRKLAQDTRYCFELFRRALADRSEDALDHLLRIYRPQVRRWVINHPAFPAADETEDYFVSVAFTQFYSGVLKLGFLSFPALAKIMAYLKRCVYTAIAQYVRDHPNADVPLPEIDLPNHIDDLAEVNAEQLWQHICNVLTTDKQRLLARCAFVFNMKPAEIVLHYGNEWSDERSVSTALYRIREILRNDSGLKGWFGVDES